MGKRPRVLLIGWDAADWKVINPLMDSGMMPALESLVNKGSIGNIATLDPPLSPMLWTSIASGKRAYDHGILGFLETTEDGEQLKPISSASRKSKAIWEILNSRGYKTQIYGWWPSHPAEPVDGIMVSNFFGKATKGSWWNDWPKSSNQVHPPELQEQMDALRVHPSELTYEQMAPFIKDIDSIYLKKDPRATHLAKDLAECLSVHAAATFGIEHHEWDFAAVYFNAIDHLSHVFMRYHPPRQEYIKEEDFELYKDVINSTYRFHDMMLARYLELIDDDTYVILLSDHGFHSDHLRLAKLPKEPAAIAREHNPLGVLCLKGPGIKADERIYGASLLDITPTILHLFDLPIGEDMEGKVLAQAFGRFEGTGSVESWEDDESSLKFGEGLGSDDAEVMQQLVDLGYVEAVDRESKDAIKKQLDENLFYLARSYADGARYVETSELLEKLCNDHPENYRYRSSLIRCYSKLGHSDAGLSHLSRLDEKHRLSPDMRLMEGELLILQGKGPKAKRIFDQVRAELGADSGMEFRLGEAYVKLDLWGLALDLFERVLNNNPDSFDALHGKGLCLMRLGKFELALDALLDSIGILYFNPSAHFHLGECLTLMEAYEEAAQALEMTLKLAPGMSSARELLISIHEKHLSDPMRLAELRSDLEQTERPVRVIVSGLPRSGTSMMMQMLEAGGIEPFTDSKRQSDEDNPKGYYEHEAIKRLAREQTAIDLAGDKAVKVISQLLPYLPPRYQYKVIFMHRPLEEVIRSQEHMLRRMGKLKEDTAVMNLGDKYAQSIQSARLWADSKPYVDFIEISYPKAVENPEDTAVEVANFLNMSLSVQDMKDVVEKRLHRNKI